MSDVRDGRPRVRRCPCCTPEAIYPQSPRLVRVLTSPWTNTVSCGKRKTQNAYPSLELFLILLSPMASYGTVKVSPEVAQRLAASGIRLTKQREEVFGLLLQKRDHPTATEVFLRAKKHMPSISLATIYNCLEALVDCGLVKQVNLDRAPTRFCANLLEHSHFYCESCGAISDVETPFKGTWNLPPGFVVAEAEVSLRGFCAKCSTEHHSIGSASSGLPTQYSKFKLQSSKRNS
jgi:Fe2+ or Zn2+ uptake regulation protein